MFEGSLLVSWSGDVFEDEEEPEVGEKEREISSVREYEEEVWYSVARSSVSGRIFD